jgi:predicted phosphodiesterase
MARKTSIQANIVKKQLAKFPNTPSLTLAKKIYKENKESFKDVESVRKYIRRYRGQNGDWSRKYIKDKTHYKEAGVKNPFTLPESHAESFEPYCISQSKILILSDLHFPYQDNKAIDLAIKYGQKKQVTCVLINGDLLDMPQHSRHERDWRNRSTKQEFDAVRQFLQYLRQEFPLARIIFKQGNHDERWEKWLYVKAPEIFDDKYFHLPQRLGFNELQIEEVKDKRPIKIGKLTVLHGHELSGGSGGVNPARATFLKTLDSVLVGHYHKTSQHTEASMYGDVYSVNSVGCLCGMNPQYMPINKWNLGFAYVEHDIKSGDYELHNLKIIKGKVY